MVGRRWPLALLAALSMLLLGLFSVGCGTDSSTESSSKIEFDIISENGDSDRSTSNESRGIVAPTRPIGMEKVVSSEPRGARIVSTDTMYIVDDFVNARYFKKSKEYDVAGLEEATAAIYGFYGPDPYDRKEFEVRFYPDHDTAITIGVDFANEATGPDAVIAKDVQRWDEGLTQRRACQGNVRGSHHSGKCDNAKYGDFVVAGNVVLLCQGKDSQSSLDNCEALMSELR